MVGGPGEQDLLQGGERRVLALGDAAQVQAHVGDHLVVAAAAGVQPGAGVADELRQPALDRHVHVLVGVGRDEGAGLDLAADGGEAVLDGLELVRAEDAGAAQRPGVRHRALDVLGPKAPVERQRAVQRHESRRALAGEAARAGDGHARPRRRAGRSRPSVLVVVMPGIICAPGRVRSGRPRCGDHPGGRP